MTRQILVDTGPIVAFLNARDSHHQWARNVFASHAPPLLTCEAVISEACFLCGRSAAGAQAVLLLLERGVLTVSSVLERDVHAIAQLMRRYANIPMSLADAILVRMSETIPDSMVLTLDSDFKIYRRLGRRVIPTNMPELG